MENKHDRKKVDNGLGDMLRVSQGLSIVVEDQVFVYPVLNKNDEKVVNIHRWHTRRVGERDEDCEDNLSISHFKDKLWSSVDLLIVVLDDASSFLGIE